MIGSTDKMFESLTPANHRRKHSASGLSRWFPSARAPVLLVMLVAMLTVSGCVYLRLLEFKGQLGYFEENFEIDVTNGLSITFLDPVILEQDMWKIGLPPTLQDEDPGGVTWILVFDKLAGEDEPESFGREIRIDLRFVDDRLAGFAVGEELFAFIPKQAVLKTLSSLGELEISLTRRKARLTVDRGPDQDFPLPNRAEIVGTLGPASSEESDEDARILTYSYRLRPASPLSDRYNPKKHGLPYNFLIEFDSKDLISGITAEFPFMGSLTIDYEEGDGDTAAEWRE